MLITKTNPVGLDLQIQKLQQSMHTVLIGSDGFNLSDPAKYKSYGRCYRNKKGTGYVAENYEGAGEYSELYWDDSLTAVSFFGLSGQIRNDKTGLSSADVHFVMFADLDKLALKDKDGNAIAHRADAELRWLVIDAIGKFSYGFTYDSTELWIENVLKEYPGSYRDDRLKAVDMHPVHCFRVNLKIIFDENKIC